VGHRAHLTPAVFEPTGRAFAFQETIAKDAPAIYRCRRVAEQQRQGGKE